MEDCWIEIARLIDRGAGWKVLYRNERSLRSRVPASLLHRRESESERKIGDSLVAAVRRLVATYSLFELTP